jgi:hypothetical protein
MDKTMRKLMEMVNGIGAEDFQRLKEYREDDPSVVADELEQIQEQMLDLLHEAEGLLQGTNEYDSARSYWLAHITTAVSNDHDYLGGSMTTMQDTIDALREGGDEDYDDEEDWDEDEDERFNDPNPRGADR